MWGKQTKKKHKTWEGDGYLIVSDKLAVLYVIINVILKVFVFITYYHFRI